MEQQNQTEQGLVVKQTPTELAQERVNNVIKKVGENYPMMDSKANAALLAMSKITQVTNDEEDTLANNLLIKVKKTFETVEPLRKEITDDLDGFKEFLMQPEKKISPLNPLSDFVRIKKLRDVYHNNKATKAKEEADTIKKNKLIEDEKIRVRTVLKKNIVDGLYDAINKLSSSIVQYIAAMNLDNWDEKSAKFSITPKLKDEVYNAFFVIPYNQQLLKPEEYAAIVNEIKAVETYEKANADYVKVADGTVKSWKDSLPDKKKELEKIRDAKPEEKDALVNAMQNKDGELIAKQNQEIKQTQEAAVNVITEEANEAALNNDFSAQVSLQSRGGGGTAKPKGARTIRKPIITVADADMVKFFSKVLFACFVHPAFDGILKKKKGVYIGDDDNGCPQYADWVTELVGFLEKNVDNPNIPGLTFKEIISTAQRL